MGEHLPYMAFPCLYGNFYTGLREYSILYQQEKNPNFSINGYNPYIKC